MQRIWSIIIVTAHGFAQTMADALEHDALAVTVLTPPRKSEARIEALYDYAPDRAEVTARLAIVAAMRRAKIPKIEIREMPKLDWLEKVAGDFPPLPIARWIVFGAQHRKAVPPSRFALQIDAASAFGTGEHPATRGCLMMLDRVLKRRNFSRGTNPSPDPSRKGRGTLEAKDGRNFNTSACVEISSGARLKGSSPLAGEDRRGVRAANTKTKLLDMGCGSGILAMAWAQAARGRAIVVDLDPESVAVAKDNVRINGLRKEIRIGFSHGYRSPLVAANAPYDIIMANIFAGPLCSMAKDLKRYLRPGGTAILAGLLNRQANAVLAAHRMQGLYLKRRLILGEWSILALHRAKSAK